MSTRNVHTHICAQAFLLTFELYLLPLRYARRLHASRTVWLVATVGLAGMLGNEEIRVADGFDGHFDPTFERDPCRLAAGSAATKSLPLHNFTTSRLRNGITPLPLNCATPLTLRLNSTAT